MTATEEAIALLASERQKERRREFARAALTGVIAAGARIDDMPGEYDEFPSHRRRRVAKDVWAMADAMLATEGAS